MKTLLRKQINNALAAAIPSFDKAIPLANIFGIVEKGGFQAICEDGTPWAGFLCGHNGHASIELVEIATGKKQSECIQLQWWGEDTHGCKGKIETNVYVM